MFYQHLQIINHLRSLKNRVGMNPLHKQIKCYNKAISKSCWFNKILYSLQWPNLTLKMHSRKSKFVLCAHMKNTWNRKGCWILRSCNRRLDNRCLKAQSFYRSKAVGTIHLICLFFLIWIRRKGWQFQLSNRYQGGLIIASSVCTQPTTQATTTYSSKWSRVTRVWSN